MRIAVWDEPALDQFARAAEEVSQHKNLTLQRFDRRPIRDLLVKGEVDVALLPALTVFIDHELFDVLPAVAISSWDFPFLKLHLKKGIGESIDSIAIDPNLAQEALVTKIILKEHYEQEPAFRPFDGKSAETLLNADGDGALFMGHADDALPADGVTLDLGRDWFELTHYPMVWGLFVTRKGDATGFIVNTLRDIARYSEVKRAQWLKEDSLPKALHLFYEEGLRYRLDDLATASLTSFQDYLYYNNVVEEIVPLPFFEVSEYEEDDEDGPLV